MGAVLKADAVGATVQAAPGLGTVMRYIGRQGAVLKEPSQACRVMRTKKED
jgi:hypothetical protein